jgi:DNA primase catalytic subunit
MRSEVDHLILKRYWRYMFPRAWPVLEQIVTCNGTFSLHQCELSPRWDKPDGQVAMARNVTFYTSEELIEYCQSKLPNLIQLGGVLPDFQFYNDRVKRNREMCKVVGTAYGPLVLDFDLCDYDRSNVCQCGDAKICCDVCFKIFGMSTIRIVHYLLEKVWGMTRIFDVFSGKKGIHIWICCERAVQMSTEQRHAFIKKLNNPLLSEGVTIDLYKHLLLPFAKENAQFFPHLDRASLIQLLYPKFDFEVTKDACHLKKLPLMPHPDTFNICVCIDPRFDFIPSLHAITIEHVTLADFELFVRGLAGMMKQGKDEEINLKKKKRNKVGKE